MTLYMRDQENIERGHAEGLKKGIMAVVHLCRKMNLSEEQIIKNISEEFSVTEDEARNYIDY